MVNLLAESPAAAGETEERAVCSMKIVLVIDQFDDANNGTTISARRFAAALKEHGNEVRVIAIGKPADYK